MQSCGHVAETFMAQIAVRSDAAVREANVNGNDLPADHGAPLRARVARQLGYKSVKYLHNITLVDSLKHVGDGRGSAQPAYGYSWYAGI